LCGPTGGKPNKETVKLKHFIEIIAPIFPDEMIQNKLPYTLLSLLHVTNGPYFGVFGKDC
jgi:hypothetical protein